MSILEKIVEAKEKLGDEVALKIAEHYHIENFNETSLKGCCPFHHENTPSFMWNQKDKAFKCFAKETKVITKYGVKEIQDIINQKVEIINGNGKWEEVTFVDCGQQKLMEVTITRFGKEKKIYATPEHGWIVQKRKNIKETKNLNIGDRLEKQWLRLEQNITPNIEGLRHGFIYGNGSLQTKNNKKYYSRISIFGENKLEFCSNLFKVTKDNTAISINSDGTAYYTTEYNPKEVPSLNMPLDYLLGFIAGYFVADGNCSDDSVQFSSSKLKDLEKIKDICTLLGIATYSIDCTIRNPNSNGGVVTYNREYPLYTMRLVSETIPKQFFVSNKKFYIKRKNQSSLGYKVMSVKKTNRFETVYCCETSTGSFVLEDFILTKNCFGCGRRLSVLDMYIDIEGSYKAALKRLFSETGIEFNSKTLEPNKKEYLSNFRYPKEETNTDRSKVENYLNKRGISNKTLDYANIKQDYYGNCVFELRDLSGTLIGVKYRPSCKIDKNKPKMWWQKNADMCPSLFNINKVNLSEPLLIVEGYIDALSVIEAGFKNVVSIPGGAEDLNWIEFNYDLLQNVEQFILWFDNDKAGEAGKEKVQQRLGEYRCKIITPTEEDIEAVSKYYQQFKSNCNKTDANNILLACGKDRIINLINNAEEIPSKRLKYLMDCKVETIKDIEKVTTGIKALDNILYGNLFPCFTIYSGKTGNGKSTVANIASLIAPVEYGYKTFVFSGELGEGQLSDWVITPLAGYNHIQEVPSKESSKPFYTVTPQAQKAIQNYYRKNMIIYSDEDGLDVSGSSLLMAMEEAYKRYGCRVFEIDNLMCLSFESLNDDNKWDTQKKFIIRLMKFAEKYKVCVNLILHPKKSPGYAKEPSADDLHGASEIGNLCHRLLWVDRLNPENSTYNTKITVIKDRPTQSAGKHCELYYDEKTRRVYSDNEELRSPYSWEKTANIKYSKEEDSKLIYHRPITSLPHEDSNYAPPM